MTQIRIHYLVDRKSFALRTRCHVPRVGDEILFPDCHYRVESVLWMEDDGAPSVHIDLKKARRPMSIWIDRKSRLGIDPADVLDAEEAERGGARLLVLAMRNGDTYVVEHFPDGHSWPDIDKIQGLVRSAQ